MTLTVKGNKVLEVAVDAELGWYIYISGGMDREDPSVVHPRVSFVVRDDENGVAADWMPPHGPVSVFHRAGPHTEDVVRNHVFDEVVNEPLSWSQLAVDRGRLPSKLSNGNFGGIFEYLKTWARP